MAPSGPTRRKEQGSRWWAEPAAAVGLAAGCGRWSRGPAGPKAIVDSRGCSTSCCCCTPTSPGGDAVRRRLHRRGAGEPGEAGADAVGPVVSTESGPRVGLLEGVGWATVIAAAGASADTVRTSVGTAKTEAKSVSAAGKARPRPGQRSTVATDAETRATNFPEGAKRSLILILSLIHI